MIEQLKKIRDALNEIECLEIYHYWHERKSAPYAIWQEEGEGDSLHTGNHKSCQVITGTLDYYTKVDYDPMVDTIQEKLNEIENLGWALDTVIYEDDTGLIHFSWTWEIA